MKRLTLLAAGMVVLAGGTLLVVGPPENLPLDHAGKAMADRRSAASSQEAEFRSAKRHAKAQDRFRVMAHEIAAMPQDTARENAIRELAQEWVREDPVAAERWGRGLEDAAERERALIPICLGVAERDSREALRIAQVNELHDGIVQAIVAQWAGRDLAAAVAWADELATGEMRERTLSRLIQVRARENPAEAAVMLADSGISDAAHEETAIAIVHQWLLKDPGAAREWVEQFPEGAVRERALGEIQGMAARGDALSR